MSITKNQSIYRRTKKPAVDLLAQQLERARAAQRARERIAEKDAEAFWSEQRAGFVSVQSLLHRDPEKNSAVEAEFRNPLKSLIRYVSHEELSRM